MKRTLIIPLCALLLLGCNTLSSVPDLRNPQAGYFEIRLPKYRLCYMPGDVCQDMGLIVGSPRQHRILKAYGLDPWNWRPLHNTANLARLMLEPPGSAYVVTRRNEKTYELPVTPQTYTVWEQLKLEYTERYYKDSQ